MRSNIRCPSPSFLISCAPDRVPDPCLKSSSRTRDVARNMASFAPSFVRLYKRNGPVNEKTPSSIKALCRELLLQSRNAVSRVDGGFRLLFAESEHRQG